MRRFFLVVLLLALAGTAGAIDIKGKWGLGVGTGTSSRYSIAGIGSGAEASLIRGKTERSAWILDLSVTEVYSELAGDSTGSLTEKSNNLAFELGPRIRKYTRPKSSFSPYLDFFVHTTGSSSIREQYSERTNYTYESRSSTLGGRAGLDLGVEYFTPWHFSLAAHSRLVNASVDRNWRKGDAGSSAGRERGFSTTFGFGPTPMLQLRVYF
jgi:hypothetical protein